MIILKPQILHYPVNMICHILVKTILMKKNDKKITDHDEYYKEETSKIQEGNESVDNS